MAHNIIIARAYCDEHMRECWQAYNDQTTRTECIDYTDATRSLKAQGYIYTGHRAGQYTYTLYKSAPLALPLDWQIAIEEHELIDIDQDW